MDRRRFLTMLGIGGVAVGGGLAGSAIEVKASAASTQAEEEDGTYAAGPLGTQRVHVVGRHGPEGGGHHLR